MWADRVLQKIRMIHACQPRMSSSPTNQACVSNVLTDALPQLTRSGALTRSIGVRREVPSICKLPVFLKRFTCEEGARVSQSDARVKLNEVFEPQRGFSAGKTLSLDEVLPDVSYLVCVKGFSPPRRVYAALRARNAISEETSTEVSYLFNRMISLSTGK